jgi:hypothetical protein
VAIDSGLGGVTVLGEDGRHSGFFEGTGPGSWVGDDETEIIPDRERRHR